MAASRILELEASIFAYGLAVIVIWKLLTGAINLRGLLMDKFRPSQISPARVQLLISTIVLAIQYLRNSGTSPNQGFSEIGSGSLYFFAGSGLIYSIGKGVERYRSR